MTRATKLVADVAAIGDRHVLLVRYRDTRRYDGQAGWFLPDDFLADAEHPDAAAARILREQAGVEARPRLGHIESFANGAWHLVFHYVLELPSRPQVAGGANVSAIEWFPLSRLPDAQDVAHDGWALEVLGRVLSDLGRSGVRPEASDPGSARR
jgi:ADP-ribose pyrophosphatase YjhB (NUDIX family)